jgi:hypothetical protein
MSAAWCGWVMLGLFLCALFSEYLQPGIISQSGSSLLTQNERTYKDAPTSLFGQLMMGIFRIGTLAMGLCLCIPVSGPFRFSLFAVVCGLVLAVLIGKMVCNSLLDYTFMLSQRFAPAYEHYANIATIVTCILYPFLLVALRIGNITVSRWIIGIAAGLFLLLWMYRSARHFVHSPMALLYFILYIVTLEVLPIALLYYLSLQTILSL